MLRGIHINNLKVKLLTTFQISKRFKKTRKTIPIWVLMLVVILSILFIVTLIVVIFLLAKKAKGLNEQ
jgi:uncharacterized membrane protein (UPF0136 family)